MLNNLLKFTRLTKIGRRNKLHYHIRFIWTSFTTYSYLKKNANSRGEKGISGTNIQFTVHTNSHYFKKSTMNYGASVGLPDLCSVLLMQ